MKLTTILTVFATTALLAQTPPAPPQPPADRFGAVQAAVGLTYTQVTQLLELRKQQGEAVRTPSQQMRERQKALRDGLQAGTADAAALGNLLLEIQSLGKKIRETHESFRAQALALLDDQQKANLAKLEEAMKLQPAIGQAAGLNLLQGPGAGPGPGPGPMMGGMGRQAPAAGVMAPMRRRAAPRD